MKQIKAFFLLYAYLSYDTWIKIFQQYIEILNDNFVKYQVYVQHSLSLLLQIKNI